MPRKKTSEPLTTKNTTPRATKTKAAKKAADKGSRKPAASDLTHAQRDSLPNAGFWRRIGAMIYDSLLVIALAMSVLLVVIALSPSCMDTSSQQACIRPAYLQPLYIVCSYGFFAFFWMRNRQTLGMLAWQLEIQPNSVAGPSGDPVIPPLTVTMITLRFIGACAGAVALGLGYLWIVIDSQNRSWSDLLSGTRIVRVPNQFAETQ